MDTNKSFNDRLRANRAEVRAASHALLWPNLTPTEDEAAPAPEANDTGGDTA